MRHDPSLLTALLLTLFLPGAGHLYLRQIAKGVAIMILFWTGFAMVFIGWLGADYQFHITKDTIVGFRVSPLLFKIYLIEIAVVLLYNFVDCIRLVSKITEIEPDETEKSLYSLIITSTADPAFHQNISIFRPEIILGRGIKADVRLPDPTVSRQHARIYQHNRAFVIQDLNSKNGTRINHQPIQEHHLSVNDHIELGSFQIRFRPEGNQLVDRPAPPQAQIPGSVDI